MSAFRLSVVAFCLMNVSVYAQLEFESPPISYSASKPHDSITELQERIESGDLILQYDERFGYLPSLLEALNVPRSSQMLVFSKTSLQLRRISPSRPRAIYFNDETYIGSVQNGDVIEISTVDPQLGAVFYTLATEKVDRPEFLRDQGQCLTCHASSRTEGVPGHLMRSVFVDRTGQPHFGSGTYNTRQSSPFEQRWGGWYVTGTHGDIRHMGNVISEERQRPEELDRESGANVTDLAKLIDTTNTLEPTSDIIALTVLAHQLEMHNLLTRGNYEAKQALHYNAVMNEALDRDAGFISESTERRIASASEKIVRCLLFADEELLPNPVAGTSQFRIDFEKLGPHDSQGRSLRDLDLKSRTFKFPCSYLIYSEAFDQLPGEIKSEVCAKLKEVLNGSPESDDFKNLSLQDRTAIREILNETKPSVLVSRSQADSQSLSE